MLEGFQELELPQGRPFAGLPLFGRGPGTDQIEPDPPPGVRNLAVDGLPGLVPDLRRRSAPAGSR